MTTRPTQTDPDHLLRARGPLWIGGLAALTLVGVLGVWGVQARIAGAVIASGLIQVESNRQVVQHPQGGVVGEILAKDGDSVAAGETLLRLDDTLLRSDLSIVEGQLYEVQARMLRLLAERDGAEGLDVPDSLQDLARANADIQALIDGQARLFQARAQALAQEQAQIGEQILQSQTQIEGAEAELAALRTQLDLIAQERDDAQSLLDKGLAQAARVSALRREEARLSGEIGRLTAGIAQVKGQIAALDIQRLRLTTARQEEAITQLRDLKLSEVELLERQGALRETLSRLDIRSPMTGTVYGSQVFALQSVISPAEPILYIIPQGQPLIVSARVEAIHIDQIHVGQEAALRFTALDQRLTPEILGRVTNLSADIFTDDLTGVSYYSVELTPIAAELDKLGQQTLLPGMPVEAFIKTAERSPLSYLTKPLTDYFAKAFREG